MSFSHANRKTVNPQSYQLVIQIKFKLQQLSEKLIYINIKYQFQSVFMRKTHPYITNGELFYST